MIELPTRACVAIELSLSLLALATPAPGLTIYRIGGDSLDPPELAGIEGVEFVQRSWADLDPDSLGAESQTHPGVEYLAPMRLRPDTNIAPLLEEMGGDLLVNRRGLWGREEELDAIRDGDLQTAYFVGRELFSGVHVLCCGNWPVPASEGNHEFKFINFDLGGPHHVERILLRTRPGRFEQEANLEEFYLLTNVGDIGQGEVAVAQRIGVFRADIAHHVFGNQSGIVDLPLPPDPARYILLLAPLGPTGAVKADWELAEVEIYGNGYPPSASYASNIIDLGGAASLGELTWSAHVDPGARLDLKARSGDDVDPNHYYRYTFRGDERTRFDDDGDELTRSDYQALEGGERAGTGPDTQSWEFWTFYSDLVAGRADLASLKPRRFVQLAADFRSEKLSGARIEFLQFAVTQPPLADALPAEIEPDEAALGDTVAFTYKIRPLVLGGNLGFDSVEIRTPVAPFTVETVRLAGAEPTGGWSHTPHDGESFTVHFQPAVTLNHGSGELLEIDFTAEVFQVGTTFAGRVFDSTRPYEVRQRVIPGDADVDTDSNTLTVELADLAHGIGALRVSPAAFTPNADGVNDVLHVEYDLVNVAGGVPVALEVYDLSGRRMAQIPVAAGSSGRYSDVRWDGRASAGGDLVPPGSYLLRLEVRSDASTESAVSLVRVVY